MKLDALAEKLGTTLLENLGDRVTRRRPVETVVDGETAQDLNADVVTGIPAMIFVVRGGKRELGWGQAPAAEYEMPAPAGSDIRVNDLIDPETGRWVGQRFRVLEVDRVSGLCALELVSAANR